VFLCSSTSNLENVLLHRHGVPEYQCEGLCVHFYAPPLALLRHKATGMIKLTLFASYMSELLTVISYLIGGTKLSQTTSVVVGLREAADVVSLPLFSHLSSTATLGQYVSEKVVFDLYLKPPVPMALCLLQKLLGILRVSTFFC